jgi:hypothetical protein
VMVSPLNNVFTFINAHTCLQCTAYQARGSSNFSRQTMRAFHMQKPTAKESLECVVRGIPGISPWQRLLHLRNIFSRVVSQLRWLVAGFSSRRPWFAPKSGRVGFLVDKVALGRVFLQVQNIFAVISFHRCSIFIRILSGGRIIGLLRAQFHRDIASPRRNNKKDFCSP